MANDLNQCNFIGRLGADPTVRYMPNGDAVCNFDIAVGWKSKDKEGAEWVRISSFGKLAEICGEYLRKGSKVFVSGQFKTRKYQDNNGHDRYATEIRCDKMQMLDSAQSSNGQSNNQGGYQQQAQQPQRQQPQQYGNGQQQPQRNQRPPANNGYAQAQNQPQQMQQPDFDDDIPFS